MQHSIRMVILHLSFHGACSLSYSYSIREDRSKQINIKTMRYPYSLTHSLNISGNIKMGSRWNVTYSSGYDLLRRKCL